MPGTFNPITVDSVSLDTYAWNIDGKIKRWAVLRDSDEEIPGVDGEIYSLSDDFGPTFYELSMWVQGSDAAGIVPSGSAELDKLKANLDQLSFMFQKRHSLIDLRELVDIAGTEERQAMCKVVDVIKPEIKKGRVARFVVTLKIPSGVWQKPDTSDFISTPTLVSGNFFEIPFMEGSTAPIDDGIFTVTGPITNPRLTDFATGAWVQLNKVLAAGEEWRINNATWTTHWGTDAGIGVTSSDNAGTQADGITDSGGGNNRLFKVEPSLIGGLRKVQISLTGTGITSATTVKCRARRKWFQ